ncbi:MAG: nucleotidyltransferase domain-containing protein [Actinomycetota bacterium]|nr:nucleotidyltransferase domain-containing protein [Actinomycetota bacterium]
MIELPEIWIYGSRARGDADSQSDTDVLIVADTESVVGVVVSCLEPSYPRVQPSYYSWLEMERMASYGSLFLHHIATEGMRWHAAAHEPNRLPLLLANLPPFTRVDEDLTAFRQAIQESQASMLDGGWADFEYEIIATVVRHAAILGAHLAGTAAFGREQPFFVCGRVLGWPAADTALLARYATGWRKHQRGRHEEPLMKARWLEAVNRFINDLEAWGRERHRVLPTAA